MFFARWDVSEGVDVRGRVGTFIGDGSGCDFVFFFEFMGRGRSGDMLGAIGEGKFLSKHGDLYGDIDNKIIFFASGSKRLSTSGMVIHIRLNYNTTPYLI